MSFFLLFTSLTSLHAAEKTEWLPSDKDYVGAEKENQLTRGNKINDWHFRLTSDSLAGRIPASWRLQGGQWYSLNDRGHWYLPKEKGWAWDTSLKAVQSGNTVDFYCDPLLAWPGDVFEITAIINQQETLTWQVMCSENAWRSGAEWKGQGAFDRIGPNEEKPDGVREWEIHIADEFAQNISRVDVILPYRPIGSRLTRSGSFDAWSTEKRIPGSHTAPLQYETDGKLCIVYINPVLACGGDEFIVRIVRTDGSWALWKVIGLGSEWENNGIWYGQDEYDKVSPYSANEGNGVQDWHFKVSSPKLSTPVRWMVRGAKGVWEWAAPGSELYDAGHHTLAADVRGSSADVFIDPHMERAGDIFYVTAVLSDGSTLNWGVTSTRQLRSLDVQWRGQDSQQTMVSENLEGVSVAPWHVQVGHPTLEKQTPWLWRIKGKGETWEYSIDPLYDTGDAKTADVLCNTEGASLFLDPLWARPGDEFNIEAFLPDGRVIQWTAVANGSEWAGAAQWDTKNAENYISHTPKESDEQADWKLTVEDPALVEQPVMIDITGMGWHWRWPDAKKASPVYMTHGGETMDLFIAPVPGKSISNKGELTCKALFADGTLRVWKAVIPGPQK